MLPEKKPAILVPLFACLLASAPPAYADDTEIYFSNPEGGGDANIIMMLDTSGSMDTNECVEWSPPESIDPADCVRKSKRMDELKTALFRVVDGLSSNARIGLGQYNQNDGGRLLYPVRGLDDIDFDGETRAYLLSDPADGYQAAAGGVIHDSATIKLPSADTDGGVVGFVFERLDIPRHAKVSEAYIQVAAAENSDDLVKYEYWYEDVASAETFDVAPAMLSRPVPATTWSGEISGTWSKSSPYRLDVTAGVAEALARPAWCGENNLAIYFSNANVGSVTSDRLIQARDAVNLSEDEGSEWAATLVVKWDATVDPPASPSASDYEATLACGGSQRYGLGSPLDDGYDNGSDIHLEESFNAVSGSDHTGLRFPRIPYDLKGALPDVLNKATLHIRGRRNSSDLTVHVKAVVGDAAEWDGTSPGSIKNAPKTGATASLTIPRRAFDDYHHEVDVTALVEEVMLAGGWNRNDDLAFVVTASASGEVAALDGGASTAPYLSISVSSPSMKPFVPRVRDRIKEVAASLNANGNTPSMEAYSEMARYYLGVLQHYAFQDVPKNEIGMLPGTEVYDTPLVTGTCTSNNIVLLTDGSPTNDADYHAVTSLTGRSSCNGGLNGEGGSYNCQVQLAEWLYDGTQNGVGVPIATHTVAFTSDGEIRANMKRVSDAGNGLHRWARNSDELQTAFEEIINTVTVQNASMAAPGVAVNQLNRFQHLDQLYYGLFKPSTNTRWEGNLKRYRLDFGSEGSEPEIVDAKGSNAVDPNTGFFKDTAQSWWSSTADGQEVSTGGAREQADTLRKLLVATTTPDAGGSQTTTTKPMGAALTLVDSYDDVSAAALGMEASASADDRTSRVSFLLNAWGDPLHSEPRLVNYGYSGELTEAMSNPDMQDNVVFVANNDGMIQAINAQDGEEYFAIMPPEELAKTEARYLNAQLSEPEFRRSTYGLDGGMTLWRKGDGSGGVDKVLLYVGQRRGGNNYYAFDVTSRSAPKILWRLQGGSGSFGKLGQTWSTPALAQIMLNGEKVPVLLFGGGYSPSDHDTAGAASSGDSVGNAIYIVNAYNGALIWSASSSGGTVSNSDMKWAIPAPISTVDIDFDGVVDYAYAADLGGQVFRVDFNPYNTGPGSLAYRVATVAQLGITEGGGISAHRRFFAPPTLALTERSDGPVVQVVLGSGYRPHPTDEQTTDRIFAIDDRDALNALDASASISAPVKLADMLDVTSTTSVSETAMDSMRGWYITLDDGEKVISAGAVVGGKLYITSYLPQETALDACTSVIGTSRLYTMDVSTGSADGARFVNLNLPGLPPQPQVIIGPPSAQGGDPRTVAIVGTAVGSGGTLQGGGLQRVRWYEVPDANAADTVLRDAGAPIP